MISAASIRNTTKVEPSTAAMYVAPGRGVVRMRLRIPDSRLTTSVIASPAKQVAATPYPIIPASRNDEPRMCSLVIRWSP